MGIVVGAFAKGSEALHSLTHHLAISRVRQKRANEDSGGRNSPHNLIFEEEIVSLWSESTGQGDWR